MAAVAQRAPQGLASLARHLRCFSSAAAQGDVVDEMIAYARQNFKASWAAAADARALGAAAAAAGADRVGPACLQTLLTCLLAPLLPPPRSRAITSRRSMC